MPQRSASVFFLIPSEGFVLCLNIMMTLVMSECRKYYIISKYKDI